MDSKIKILIGILVIGVILVGGWWIWGSFYRCSSENPKFCNRNCNVDSDCLPTCGCGCISKGERCYSHILCFALLPCKCVNGVCQHEDKQPTPEVTITTDKTEYEQGEMVKITVKNGAKEERCVSPDYEVESFKQGKWMKIKKTWCPCEVICSIQPCKLLQPNEIMDYEWYQKESWCTGPQGRSETIYKQVDSGIYRIKIQIDKEEVYSNKFTIKEKSPDYSLIFKGEITENEADCGNVYGATAKINEIVSVNPDFSKVIKIGDELAFPYKTSLGLSKNDIVLVKYSGGYICVDFPRPDEPRPCQRLHGGCGFHCSLAVVEELR